MKDEKRESVRQATASMAKAVASNREVHVWRAAEVHDDELGLLAEMVATGRKAARRNCKQADRHGSSSSSEHDLQAEVDQPRRRHFTPRHGGR